VSLFTTKYYFIHDERRSREFTLAGGCAREGASRLKRPSRRYLVRVDENTGRFREYPDTVLRVRELLVSRPLGTNVIMEAYGTDGSKLDQTRFRRAEKGPLVADTEGVLGIDRWVGWMNEAYPNTRWAGICVCKANSDHRDCAAADNFDTEENMREQVRISQQNADYFMTKYDILFRTIYFPGEEPKPYYGDYHAHVHHSVYGGIPGEAC